jgi:uncharacterized protein (DUF2147 family)
LHITNLKKEANMMKRVPFLATLAVLVCASLVLAAESPVGKWNTVDEKTGKVASEVTLYEQDGKLFGKITGLPEPNDAQGKPKTCTPCTGADKNQPIIGLVIIKDLSLKGDRYKGGTLLDPDDGKIYKGEVWIEGGKLKVRGYLSLFYRTQTWVRGK